MNEKKVESLEFALDFMMQLNRGESSKTNCYVVLQKTEDNISILSTDGYPLEESDYQMLLLIDMQQNHIRRAKIDKWKAMIDRLSALNGVLIITVQFTPDKAIKRPVHESN